MYRVCKKTTKATQYYCLKCPHHKSKGAVNIECTAKNKVIYGEFNPKYFYCIEEKGFCDMTDEGIERLSNEMREKESDIAFSEYVKSTLQKPKQRS